MPDPQATPLDPGFRDSETPIGRILIEHGTPEAHAEYEALRAVEDIVRGYEGRNALLMLPKYALEWLARQMGDYPVTADIAGHVSSEVHRALNRPMPVTHVHPRDALDKVDEARA